jgi:hypothetical protein
MAASLRTYDTDIITLRQVAVRTPTNGYIPNTYILISNGTGGTSWGPVSSILAGSYDTVSDANGSTLSAYTIGPTLPISSIGIQGLMNISADIKMSSLTINNQAPNLLVALNTVPTVSRQAAAAVPNSENITMSTSQSTLKFIGVGDIQLSTVTDLRAVFFSISSFTAQGYSDLSGEARAWRGFSYSTTSTAAGYASFISSIPFSTFHTTDPGTGEGYGWDWSPALGEGIPMSTTEAYPNYYSTGDVYFSTVSFTMAPFLRYIHPNSTTKMFLEVNPSYFFQRMYLGTSTPQNFVKEFSTFLQYESPRTGRQVLGKSSHGNFLTSQQSNAYTSNYYNTAVKLEIDTGVLTRNAAIDGPSGAYYTLYHRIPGAMANLIPDGYCGYNIGPRGGFSNDVIVNVDNRTSIDNSIYLHLYNQAGNAAPMPGP